MSLAKQVLELAQQYADDTADQLSRLVKIPSLSGQEEAVNRELARQLADAGFDDVRVHYFHYHAGMPYLQSEDPDAFRRADVALEDDSSGWRGMFLASAFVIHARRPAESPPDAR